jgi:putative endonuclease
MAQVDRRKQRVGRWGEDFAAKYLESKGYQILERNVRTSYGEIDLLARLEDLTVFVEVKTRTSLTFGQPEEAVTQKKREHMQAAAEAYIQAHPEIAGDWRIDVISIYRRPSTPPEIVHFENALS